MSLRTVAPQQKYGLVKKKTTGAAAPTARRPLSNVFGHVDEEVDDDLEMGAGISRVNKLIVQRSTNSDREAVKVHSEALSEDASVFDYDGAYDSFKTVPAAASHPLSRPAVSEAPKAKYVNNLKAMASVREKEKERIFERKLLKERENEDSLYGDKPKFMTTAYKKKLQETQKWDIEDKINDEIDSRTDVRTKGMQGFYSNLLTKNVSVGGDVASSALSAYTAGSNRQHYMEKSGSADEDVSTATATKETDSSPHSGDSCTSVGRDDVVESSDDHTQQKRHHDAWDDDNYEDDRDIHGPKRVHYETSVERDAVPENAVASKADAVSAARLRYLERKNKTTPS